MPLDELTQQDRAFIQTLKSQGFSKEETFKALVKVKEASAPKAPTPTSQPFDIGTFYQDKEVQTALKQSAKTPDTQLPQGGMSKQPEGVVAPEPTEQQLIMGGSTKPLTPEAKQGMEAAGYQEGAGEFAQGALKSVAGTASNILGASERAGKAIARTVLPESLEKPLGVEAPAKGQAAWEKLFPEGSLESKSDAEKAGMVTAEILQFLAPGMLASKLGKVAEGANLITKLPKALQGAAKIATRSAIEGTTAAAVTAAQEGELNKDVAASGAIGAALPVVGAVAGKVLNVTSLMKKALGIPKVTSAKISNIAKQGGYESLEDFALQKGLKGDREEMLDQVANMFSDARQSKADVIKDIAELTPNKYDELFGYLKQQYATPGQSAKLKEIIELANKPKLTAAELERVRYLADETLPRAAYSGAEPVKTEGVQNMVDQLRSRLGELDKSGVMKQSNADIRVFYKMMDALDKSAQSDVLRQMGVGTILRGAPSAALGLAVPGLREAIIASNLVGLITDVPRVASNLAQFIKKMPDNEVAKLLSNLAKASTQTTAQEVGD